MAHIVDSASPLTTELSSAITLAALHSRLYRHWVCASCRSNTCIWPHICVCCAPHHRVVQCHHIGCAQVSRHQRQLAKALPRAHTRKLLGVVCSSGSSMQRSMQHSVVVMLLRLGRACTAQGPHAPAPWNCLHGAQHTANIMWPLGQSSKLYITAVPGAYTRWLLGVICWVNAHRNVAFLV